MKSDHAAAFASRCERWSIARPALYDFGVAAFALLGITYPLMLFVGTILAIIVLAFVLHGIAALFFLKVVWLLAIPLFGIVRSFFRKPSPIPGVRLSVREAPELFALLDRLRNVYRAPRLDGVYLVPEFQAAVVMRPRFGLLGGTEHHLIVGLPTLLSLEMPHFEAILAHEFGHIAQGLRPYDRFIYAIRSTVGIVFEAKIPKWLHPPLRIFASWWYPRFDISSMVVARRVEREADRLAASTAGAKTFAEALVAFVVQELRLQRDFWPAIERLAAVQRTAPDDIMSRQMAIVDSPLANVKPLLEIALAAEPDPGDTHPVLGDRLGALGVASGDATTFLETGEIERVGSAAGALFGDSLPDVLHSIGIDWAQQHEDSWAQAYGRLHAQRRKLQDLDKRSVDGSLDENQSRERALLAGEVYRGDARVLLEEQAEKHPTDATVLVHLGRTLLNQYDDLRGLDFLERAARAHRDGSREAVAIGSQYLLLRSGRTAVERFLTTLRQISAEHAQGVAAV